jgi:hypothetical protein
MNERDKLILLSERILHKDCDCKNLVEKKSVSLKGLGAKTN